MSHTYSATIPDTLDLSERAALAINGLGGTLDPNLYYLHYFNVFFNVNPPYMLHMSPDTTCTNKYAESFPMMRLMCASTQYADAEAQMNAYLMSCLEDGLFWNRVDPRRPWRISYNPDFDGAIQDVDLSNVVGNARLMRALVTRREASGDRALDKPIRALVGGLERIAVHRGEYSYYPDGGFGEPCNYPRSGWQHTHEPTHETEGGEGSMLGYQGHQIQALARWYALSGDEQALDLARRLTSFCMFPQFWGGIPDPDGSIEGLVSHVAAGQPDPVCVAGSEQGHWYSHFHSRAIALRGMLEYARVAHDWRVIEFVRRAFEYTWTLGIPRIGWVNCYPASRGANHRVEGCALGDLAALGVRLNDAGAGDYWDDVDALVRNHLVEQQLVNADLLQRAVDASPRRNPKERSPYPGQETEEDVIARSLGTFAGHSTPVGISRLWVMQCCTGNATQGLYYAWESIVREEGDRAQVNLLLNRAAPGLDVDSYLPYEGKVIIRNKDRRQIAVRIPGWVSRLEVRAWVSEAPRPLDWVGNYIVFAELKPGDAVRIEFPVPETSASYTVSTQTPDEQIYRCTFRGSTLVDISPRDETPTSYPLYLRDPLKQGGQAPLKIANRYVADARILHW